MTITHGALDLTVQPPSIPPMLVPMDIGHETLLTPHQLLTSGGHHCRPVQICSLEDSPPLHAVLTSGGQSTYRWQASSMNPTAMLSLFLIFLGDHREAGDES